MALTADRDTIQMGAGGVPDFLSLPVAASTVIYKGSLVALNSSGYLVPGSVSATLKAVGRAEQHVDNSTGLDGALSCRVFQGAFSWDTHGTAVGVDDVGSLCWIYDDHTITLDSTGASIAGTICGYDANGVFVMSQLTAPLDASSISAVASDLDDYITDVASTANGEGAALVGIEDSAALITATTVEGALAELVKKIFYMGVAPQALSGAGACNVTALVTNFTSTGSAQALTLADGTQTGQLKIVHHTVDGGSGVLTPTTAGNFATFTLTNVHDACLLQWTGSAWNIVLNVGGTVA